MEVEFATRPIESVVDSWDVLNSSGPFPGILSGRDQENDLYYQGSGNGQINLFQSVYLNDATVQQLGMGGCVSYDFLKEHLTPMLRFSMNLSLYQDGNSVCSGADLELGGVIQVNGVEDFQLETQTASQLNLVRLPSAFF